ncbi:MAG: hypothetical protein ACI959_000012 [Limisphaerales bacterium]
MLTGADFKVWTLSDRTNDGTPELLNDCELSFKLTFSANGSWSSVFTDMECIPETKEGSWSFDAAETILTISEAGITDSESWEVISLSETSFTYNREFLGVEQISGYNSN